MAPGDSVNAVLKGGTQVTKYQRAAQLWSVLSLAAMNRQVLTYDIVSKLIGVPRPALGGFLDPVQAYCLKHHLPPLTVLVVSEQTGMPGSGFTAAEDIPKAQVSVFGFDWIAHGAPPPEDFEAALEQ